MRLQSTTFLSKIIFYPFAVTSTIFTVILFYDFGDSIPKGVIWAVVGFGMDAMKIYFLAKIGNAMQTRHNVKAYLVALYLMFAGLSSIASLVFGISTIERQAMKVDGEGGAKYELAMRIKDAEERLQKYPTQDNDGERRSIDRQIEALTGQISNITVGVSERSIQITREIRDLRERRNRVGKGKDAEKDALIQSISDMRRDYAVAARGSEKAKASFQVFADFLGVKLNTLMVAFLGFVVISMEIGMAFTSGPAVSSLISGEMAKPKKEKKKSPQMNLPGIG